MALFEALGLLAGTALVTSAPACDIDAGPVTADTNANFSLWLKASAEAGALDAIVDALAREIWVGAETRGLSQQALEHHARGVAGLLIAYPPQTAQMTQAIERARANGGTAPSGEPCARRIAVDIFARSRSAGAIAAAGLKDDVTLFMIDRVYAHLLDDAKTLTRLTPVLKEFGVQKSATSDGAHGGTLGTGLAGFGLPEPLTHHLAAAGGTVLLADLRERYGLSEKAIAAILALLDRQSVKPGDLVVRLEELAAWLGDIKAQLSKPSNEDAEVRRLKSKAASALADGDFEAASDILKQVRREVREARRRIEERMSDEVAALKVQMNEEARATARLAELALAGQDYATAADLFGEAALSLPTVDRDGAWRLSLQRAEALVRLGEATESLAALSDAIAAFGQLLRGSADGSNPKGLAQASLGLAHALALSGRRESGTARLKDAIAAYRKAISLFNPANDLKSWTLAQLRLAQTLVIAGEREQAPAILHEAAQAFRDALKDIKPDRAADLATAQMGLGNVLLTLEEKEPGTPLLVEAAAAYTAALAVLSRTADASLWAEAQMNLGLARLGLGEQESGTERLEAAVESFRSALEVSTRAAAPEKWAPLQLNLGNALAALGDRKPGSTEQLDDAIRAYNAALEVFNRETEPMKWAIAQMNLGTALVRIGDHRDKRRNWLAAAGALVPALEVFEQHGATAYADVTRRNLRRFNDSWDNPVVAPAPPTSMASEPAPKPRLAKAG